MMVQMVVKLLVQMVVRIVDGDKDSGLDVGENEGVDDGEGEYCGQNCGNDGGGDGDGAGDEDEGEGDRFSAVDRLTNRQWRLQIVKNTFYDALCFLFSRSTFSFIVLNFFSFVWNTISAQYWMKLKYYLTWCYKVSLMDLVH